MKTMMNIKIRFSIITVAWIHIYNVINGPNNNNKAQ